MITRGRFARTALTALVATGLVAGAAGTAHAEEAVPPAVVTEETVETPDTGAAEAAAEATMTITPGSLTTGDWQNPDKGIFVEASGFTPGETVQVTAEYAGVTYQVEASEADEDGWILFQLWLESGASVAGTVTVTAVGDVSGVTVTGSATITADPATPATPPAPVVPGATAAAGAAAAPVAPTNLPIVSG
ncbi:hypothetical protein [Microbacterium sp. Leaf320]|uniref:hypothetical protein n=1 Tax=Microbacterium sp. Leaf320 TaxID=1736334 RepID=UPI0006F9500B|nr:hypothetical protein [Microbacterium sp. Leaf320]KQQ65365.1 hypothetical protein ASF63_15630 [Microbacterium sp. Leaf320]